MNELIDELAQQCYVKTGSTHTDHFEYWKFAELLIQECIGVPYDMWDNAELNADIAVKIEHRIKEHFGIESQ